MKINTILFLSLLILSITLHGCFNGESDFDKRVRLDDEAIRTYLDNNNIVAEKSHAGIYFEALSENDHGTQAMEDHVVSILYSLKLLSGDDVIEASTDTLNPLKFSYSHNGIIPEGVNHAISLMREGEKFRFYLPSYWAYGEYSHDGVFSVNSNFILEIELISLKTEEEFYEIELDSINSYIQHHELEVESYPNGLYYKKVEDGSGIKPRSNDLVRFHFTRKYLDGTVITTTEDDDPVQVRLNQNNLVRGLEEGLKLMKEGEEAILIMPSKLAFGKSLQVIPQKVREDWVKNGDISTEVLPFSSVLYEIRLLDVD